MKFDFSGRVSSGTSFQGESPTKSEPKSMLFEIFRNLKNFLIF